jgi:hypothetical protein
MICFAFLEVSFIGRIIGVRFASNLDVSLDGYTTPQEQTHFLWLPLFVVCFSDEAPVPRPVPLKVFSFDPAPGFVRVPSSGPSPQTGEDFMIHATENALTHDVPMIVGPATYLRVELSYQIGGS